MVVEVAAAVADAGAAAATGAVATAEESVLDVQSESMERHGAIRARSETELRARLG